uniref:Survival protein SurE-like phosphatase/nucleotidase domain-containing protein n=1 Tax=Chenopodium quinoa TaxID=63459 RepID=A0A803MRP1_CHEQI
MNSSRRNALPPSLVANLQQVLSSRKNVEQIQSQTSSELTQSPSTQEQHQKFEKEVEEEAPSTANDDDVVDSEETSSKPVILVTNGDGIESPGLVALVDALVRNGRFDVHVCAPQFDKSASGHSLTVRETVEVNSAEISGATAFEVSGTPADCVSLALSQALFSWSKPLLVLSGINKGSSCGQNMLYSGAIAGSREALIHGVPSICMSLDWKKDVSSENDFKDAVEICLPLINATIKDIENGSFPKGCFLNVEIPNSPSSNKGAARRLNTNRKTVEVESVGVAGKPKTQQTIRKHYRLEFLDEEKEDADDELDFKAVQNGFVAITPLALSSDLQSESHLSVSNWLSPVLAAWEQ